MHSFLPFSIDDRITIFYCKNGMYMDLRKGVRHHANSFPKHTLPMEKTQKSMCFFPELNPYGVRGVQGSFFLPTLCS
jgi:hypothetical protein